MSNSRRWRQSGRAVVAAAATAGAVLLVTACGGGSNVAAGSAITPAAGGQVAGFPGTSASPAVLPTATPSGMASMTGMPSTAPAAAGQPVAADAVTIRNFAFGPQVVSVKAGTTVHWTNQDSEAHTVTSDTGAFGSTALQPGSGYSFTFTKPGTYSYHCTIHPFMTGKVVVS